MIIRALRLATRVFALAAVMFVASTLNAELLHSQSDGTEMLNDASAREAIQKTMRSTQAKNVSIEPLVLKVREGVAKNSDAIRIQSAVQLLARRLELSSAALAPTYSVEELSAGASVLQVGVPVSTLRDMRKLWPTKPLTVPLGILYELVAHEVPVKKATQRVRELLQRGASSAQLVTLAASVEADVAAGLSADAALELRTKGVMSLLPAAAGAAAVVPIKPPPTGTAVAPGKPPIRPK